jgi:hypothetical protein
MSKNNKKIDIQNAKSLGNATDDTLEALLDRSITEIHVFRETEVLISYLLPCGLIVSAGAIVNPERGIVDIEAGKQLCRREALSKLKILEGYRSQHRAYAIDQSLKQVVGVPEFLTDSQVEALLEKAVAETRNFHNMVTISSYLLPSGYTILGMSHVGLADAKMQDAAEQCFANALVQLRELEKYRTYWDIYLYHLQLHFKAVENAGKKRMQQEAQGTGIDTSPLQGGKCL